ncbi:MAG: tol-pal system protein YbgF [Fulvivirga sp.]|nr:tol-pal system protein YbgF [Fulvivirga sp.]
MVRQLLIIFLLTVLSISYGQSAERDSVLKSDQVILIEDMQLQIEIAEAMNNLYNFNFDEAEKRFRWLKQKYGWHPLPYFLLGLSEWWKIMPNMHNTAYDEKFLAYMDTVVMISERLHEIPRHEVEGAFFLAAAYGFKGRLYSSEERKNWGKAAFAGKNALKYMQESEGLHYLSPELLFGDALYNYFSVWVPENYPLLKPVLAFFPKGDKELGIEQLKEVSYNAFYTRTEAQVFLMRIWNSYENERRKALQLSEYLHQTYPGNPYFHRYYARLLYGTGQYTKVEPIAKNILAKVDSGATGYEENSGRYAAFFLGQVYEAKRDYENAKYYYKRVVDFAQTIDATESGYYLYSLIALGDIAKKEGNEKEAKKYYKLVKKEGKRKHSAHKRAREKLKDL